MRTTLAGAFAAAGVALGLAGCDPVYGVMRDADLDAPVELDCVRHAIAMTPGVASVTFRTEEKRLGVFHPEPTVYSFLYEGAPGGKIRGTLQIYRDYQGRFSYHDTYLGFGWHPTPAAADEIEATRPVMRAIEKKLAADCGVTKLPSQVREKCTRLECRPLEEN